MLIQTWNEVTNQFAKIFENRLPRAISKTKSLRARSMNIEIIKFLTLDEITRLLGVISDKREKAIFSDRLKRYQKKPRKRALKTACFPALLKYKFEGSENIFDTP